jgi:F0F1-type ATP synthase assembly protein I
LSINQYFFLDFLKKWSIMDILPENGLRGNDAMGSNKGVYQAIALAGQFGFTILVPALLCFWVGYRLDKWLGTNFLVIIFFFIGAIAGIVNIFILAKKIGSGKNEED